MSNPSTPHLDEKLASLHSEIETAKKRLRLPATGHFARQLDRLAQDLTTQHADLKQAVDIAECALAQLNQPDIPDKAKLWFKETQVNLGVYYTRFDSLVTETRAVIMTTVAEVEGSWFLKRMLFRLYIRMGWF